MRLETPRHPWPLSHSPWNPSRSPSVPIPPLLSLPLATERSRRHRRAPSRPPATPRKPDAPRSSATLSSSSSMSHASREGPEHRHRRRLPPRAPTTAAVDSPSPPPPRARRPSLRTHREPLSISPLSPCPSAPSNHPGCRSRPFLAAGDDADGARATVANSRARQRAQHPSRSRARPPVRPAVPPSANPDLAELRPPPNTSPAPFPATPNPTTCTTRRGPLPAIHRAQRRPERCPVRETRTCTAAFSLAGG